jgi:acyl-CoA synthetase (AMP-forming)/AMP-acid ligase II
MPEMPQTLVQMLGDRAQELGEQVAFGYLPDGEGELTTTSYVELDSQARRIATVLAGRIAPGGRVVLVYPPDLDFIAGIFGALYAGLIPVPIYPPNPAAPEAGAAHLRTVVADCSAEAVLTTELLNTAAASLPGLPGDGSGLPWIPTDGYDCRTADPGDWRDPGIGADSLALIQYTSGSTAAPRGAVLTHGNLLANQVAIDRSFARPQGMVGVGWLPTYHDMGLIGNLFHPAYLGRPCYLMSPMHFLQKPVRWLRAIERFGGTYSGGPNFGYELCLRRISAEETIGLDLSSWQVAFCGAEPIMPGTVHRFTERFAPHGFRPGTFYPCYGLAESALLVTGAVSGAGARMTWIDREKLGGGAAIAVDQDAPGAVQVVSSGRPPAGTTLAVVDPESRCRRPDGEVGEIWVSGRSVAQGYWRRPDLTEQTFGPQLPGADGTFLRTGDLGFLLDGELYVTGRIKDLIIVRGRNIYPQDIELAVQQADPRLRPGCGAVFGVEKDGVESVVVVQETGEQDTAELEWLARAARRAVAERHQVELRAIALLPPRSLPKTTSGKIRRSASRTAFLERSLPVLAQFGSEV